MGKLQRHVPRPLRPDQGLDVPGTRNQRGSRSVDHLLGRIRTEVNDKIQVRFRSASLLGGTKQTCTTPKIPQRSCFPQPENDDLFAELFMDASR